MKSLKKIYNKKDKTVTEYLVVSKEELEGKIVDHIKYKDMDEETKALVDEAINQYKELVEKGELPNLEEE